MDAGIERKTPTIQDVARSAGVSTATVSRALSSPERVSEATRERVSEAVAATGYTINQAARSLRLRVQAPAELAKYIAHKGSICVDGVSLTVNAVQGSAFELNIVPHTGRETIIAGYRPGSRVNLEVDVIARYLERLLLGERAVASGGITPEFLARHGFAPNE